VQSNSRDEMSVNRNNHIDNPSHTQVSPFAEDNVVLIACRDCGRKFNEKALQRHSKICKKVFINKRNTFDSSNARKTDEQIDLERKKSSSQMRTNSRPMKRLSNSKLQQEKNTIENIQVQENPLKKIPKWKLQSEQFRRAMGAPNSTTTDYNKPQGKNIPSE